MFDSNGTVSKVFPGFMDDFDAVANFFVHLVVDGFSNDFNRATSIVHYGRFGWGVVPRSRFGEREEVVE